MGVGDSSRAGAAKERYIKMSFYEKIVIGAAELGEVARIEVEIQKLFPPASPECRCPCWHHPVPNHRLPANGPVPKLH